MNKYVQLYQSELATKTAGIMEDIVNYKPMNFGDVVTKGMPAGAIVGAGAGAIHGLMSKDEYDPNTGEKKSKIKKAIWEAILGAGAGTVAAAASPTLLRAGLALGGKASVQAGKALHGAGINTGVKPLVGTGLKSVIASTPVGSQLSLKQLAGIFTNNKK